MALQKGNVVLVPFPFSDLSQTKLRPAVVIWVDLVGSDVTLCFISSQNIDQLILEELLLDKEDPEFKDTGLKVSSKVKVTKVVTIDRSLIKRRLGKLGKNQVKKINAILLKVFQIP